MAPTVGGGTLLVRKLPVPDTAYLTNFFTIVFYHVNLKYNYLGKNKCLKVSESWFDPLHHFKYHALYFVSSYLLR